VAAAVDAGQLVERGLLLELAKSLDRQVEVGQGTRRGVGVERAELLWIDAQPGSQRVPYRARGV